jgi:hypothetical protein
MVFEGEKTEKQISDNMTKYFLNESTNTVVYGFHCGEIYSLYNKLQKDEDLELFTLLKENLYHKNSELKTIEKEQISEMYLFFDYDGHAASANEEKLQSILELSDNETEDNGKLYISYPMVEAIKHLDAAVEYKTLLAQSEPNYKSVVASAIEGAIQFKDLKRLSKEGWAFIIDKNCKKANFIVNDDFSFPTVEIKQIDIFYKQKQKYINPQNKVAVLSAFPIFLADYYGYGKLEEMIDAR